MKMDIEKLILCVKKYPMLYDPENIEYKHMKQKDHIWDVIGEELQENGEELKKKWKNLRDCYARHIRSWDVRTKHTANDNTRYYKFWPWAKQMDIFKPYFKCSRVPFETDSNESQRQSKSQSTDPISTFQIALKEEPVYDTVENDHEESLLRLPTKSLPSTNRKILTRKRRIREREGPHNKFGKIQSQKRQKLEVNSSSCLNNLTATEHLFLGFAKTVESFSARRQASVKMKIADIVFEEELYEKEEIEQRSQVVMFDNYAEVVNEDDEEEEEKSFDLDTCPELI